MRQSLQRFFVRWLDAVVGLFWNLSDILGIGHIRESVRGHEAGVVFYTFPVGSLWLYSGVYYIWNNNTVSICIMIVLYLSTICLFTVAF